MTNTTATEGLTLDLNDPIWTIAHVAQAFHVSVDRARDYTSRDDFPGARRLGVSTGRLLWPREGALAGFASQPSFRASVRRRNTSAAVTVVQAAKPSTYRPRTRRLAQTGEAA